MDCRFFGFCGVLIARKRCLRPYNLAICVWLFDVIHCSGNGTEEFHEATRTDTERPTRYVPLSVGPDSRHGPREDHFGREYRLAIFIGSDGRRLYGRPRPAAVAQPPDGGAAHPQICGRSIG